MNVLYVNRANMIALCSIQHLMLWRNCCLEPKNERATKDSSFGAFVKRMENYSAQELLQKKVKYHKSCYSSFANADKVLRAQKSPIIKNFALFAKNQAKISIKFQQMIQEN